MKRVHITTGDPDGIGLEVSLKALSLLGPKKDIQFVLWRAPLANKEVLKLADNRFNRISIKENSLFTHQEKREKSLLDIATSHLPTQWVVKATKHCLKNKNAEALVTGPLSKIQMKQEGFKEKGHTGLLKNLSHTRDVFMTFIGDLFNVTLLTGHVPLKKVKWNTRSLNKCIELCFKLKPSLSIHQRKKKNRASGLQPSRRRRRFIGHRRAPIKGKCYPPLEE
jgi:4-hydroxythreonine-4-phosphate dehydrogenase